MPAGSGFPRLRGARGRGFIAAMRRILSLALIALCPPAWADPAPPEAAPEIAGLEWGIFCALRAMDRAPAPGTIAGWLHVPREEITFHWPGEAVVPASIGLAFGVRAAAVPGHFSDSAEARVFRPGREAPETWPTAVSDTAQVSAFFRFDDASELIPGIWAFEVWDRGERLYRVEFEVVPAEARREIADACGATS